MSMFKTYELKTEEEFDEIANSPYFEENGSTWSGPGTYFVIHPYNYRYIAKLVNEEDAFEHLLDDIEIRAVRDALSFLYERLVADRLNNKIRNQ